MPIIWTAIIYLFIAYTFLNLIQLSFFIFLKFFLKFVLQVSIV
jgi:hypothetical protein